MFDYVKSHQHFQVDTKLLYITIKVILPLFFYQKKVIPHRQCSDDWPRLLQLCPMSQKGTGSGAYVVKNLQGCCTRMHELYALGQVPVSLTPSPPHPRPAGSEPMLCSSHRVAEVKNLSRVAPPERYLQSERHSSARRADFVT